ncbi:PDGF- and VEGF-receptor related isoform X3 [Anticarsia gemmatalis]|uniref:PDGF- and VEGF-receptor related isoform X3 n=2 Tax=Anticarsia gemmatalis TaxID=129554 RepID=UPI003F759441
MTNSWDLHLLIVLITTAVVVISTPSAATTTCEDSQRLNGPIIEPCKSEIILQKGQNFTITCKGKHPVEFKQQETPEDLISLNLSQSKQSINEGGYKYRTDLELSNVDQYTIGYYACFYESVKTSISNILNTFTEEPSNTKQIAYIYIYVNGTDSLFAPMREIVTPRNRFTVVIECRPTTPDVVVSLTSASNKTPDSVTFSPKIGFIMRTCSRSAYKCEGQRGNDTDRKRIRNVTPPPVPKVSRDNKYFLKGETFSISCSVEYGSSTLVSLDWQYPPNIKKDSIHVVSNEYEAVEGKLYRNITVVNATEQFGGTYVCVSKNNCGEKYSETQKEYLREAFLNLKPFNKPVTETSQKAIKLNIAITSYPPANFEFLRNGKPLPNDPSKYVVQRNVKTGDAILRIVNLNITDTANYTLVADNGHLNKEETIDLRVIAPPVISFGSDGDRKFLENTVAAFKCDVTGYPIPEIVWTFSVGEEKQNLTSSKFEVSSVYEATAYLEIPVHVSGNISCEVPKVNKSVTRQLIVYEMEGGFGVKNRDNTWFSQNQDATITCIASKYEFSSVTWIDQNEEMLNNTVEYTENPFSLVAKLKIPQISLDQSGEYICRGVRLNDTEEEESVNITVAAIKAPRIMEPLVDKTEEVYPFQEIKLSCQAEGVPPPKVEWYKDAEFMKNDSNAKIITRIINRTGINSTLLISKMDENYKGTYECVANSEGVIARRMYTLIFKAEATYTTYLSVIIVIIIILIVVVIYLTLKIRKEKQFRRKLAAAGLLYFKEGIPKSLNPDLGIDEQAELLPYDEKFEFPPEKLILGKQLGAGAFGVVFKAEARGIINAEETTEVAVKMVKKTADDMYIKALASELKIMVHLGKHINIVNLLGACTKNVGKRELSVIVEYCKFGNIHNYMQRHREVFIDQLTDNKEKNLGRVNRGFSCSSGSTGVHSDYFGPSNTQETDHTFVNTANTNRSTRKDKPNQQVEFVKVSEGYVQPEWRSNYESDYSFDGRNPRPLTSRDLLVWAFQIARGMEYLASRKVLHGDLAARNVLLAEDNIVKICDFGLARSIYKNDEYQKKENSLLPVRWLAIECMTDRIFSTQSDVWSFGIVLWELFSLAKTPYPDLHPADLLRWLTEGKRLAKPTYSDDRLYDVMLRCWEQKPTARPTFTQLQEIIGGFLEDNVRNHYVDLNSAYMDMNAEASGHEDYLIMMNAPDYNNLVTPSPHHYVNDISFFPTTPTQLAEDKKDEDGYLKMNPASRQIIFSPRPENNTFDFDARKFNPRVSEASSCGSELTPMLTLNNLPARSGSDSDHEGSASPYITVCPTIDEETDEVFETKHNNAKNAIINSAVTNPTYITLDVDIEKKPKDIINAYINVPNGLVK